MDDYPIYETVEGVRAQIGQPNQNQVISVANDKSHIFKSGGGNSRVILNHSNITFVTNVYSGWDDFNSRYQKIVNAFERTYKIPFYTRAGLRFKDVFVRSKYGIEEIDWRDLINPEFLGPLGSEIADNSLFDSACNMKFKGNDCQAKIALGIVVNAKSDGPIEDRERCLMMDSDVFCMNKINKEDASVKLGKIHEMASLIFRSAITERLDQVLRSSNVQVSQ